MDPIVADTSLQQGILNLSIPSSIAAAALTGIFCKLYDDVIDLKIYKEGAPITEILKVCITCFTTLMASSNIFASLFILILSVVELSYGSADTPFWKMGILIPITTTILHFISLPWTSYSSTFISINIFIIIAALAAVFFEKKLFPEETSFNKINNRVLCVAVSAYSIYKYYDGFSYFPIIPIILSWVIGYMGTYVIDHLVYTEKQTKESHSD